jgi:hypothetical protein
MSGGGRMWSGVGTRLMICTHHEILVAAASCKIALQYCFFIGEENNNNSLFFNIYEKYFFRAFTNVIDKEFVYQNNVIIINFL